MTPPVYSVNVQNSPKKATLNLLPCRIHYDGAVDPSDTYWTPSQNPDGTKTAYLRGRQLKGKALKLPAGYYGAVADKSDPRPEERSPDDRFEDAETHLEQDGQPEVGSLKAKAVFDEMVIWGHESTSDATADPYIRGIDEWITLADQMHSYPTKSDTSSNGGPSS
ncbi:ribonuclease H1 small subunit [Xylariaceae sp. FL0804]|nr:ribonuclease H1 small subunit [Xylariaceae sp. FL0804]